jgi:uncharacterized RDD family membrane protein YckC
MADWLPYQEAREADIAAAGQGAADPAAGEFCSQCGRQVDRDDMIQYEQYWVCADCKDSFFQRVREGVPPAVAQSQFRFAGFWIRFAAVLIDGVILWVVHLIIGLVTLPLAASELPGAVAVGTVLRIVLANGIAIAYEIYFVGKYAATPGKMACGIRIIVAGGARVSYLRALGRWAAELLSGLVLAIGYLMAAFDDEKRALHDHICNTRVVYKK